VGLRQGVTPGQGARSAEREQDLMKPETVRSERVDAAVGSVPGLRQGGTLGQRARSAERQQDPMMSLPPGACPGGETVRLAQVDAGVGSVPSLGPGGTLGQGARSAACEQELMNRGTVRLAQVDAGVGSVPSLGPDGTLGQGARSAERERDATPGRPPGRCPGGGAGGLEDAAVPRRMAGTSPAMTGSPALTGCKGGDRDPKAAPATGLRPGDGAVRSCGWKLRRVAELRRRRRAGVALADSADRAGRRLTAQMAIHAAAPAGQDWRPGMAEALRRMAEAAERLRARCIPRAGGVADVVRRDGVAGGAR
jgi:hypothetical protein